MTDLTCSLSGLAVYPIKSAAGIDQSESLLVETGLDLDRAWMVIDAQGQMLTQRDWPRLALIRPQLRQNDLVLRAPGMLALHLALDVVEDALQVSVWNDSVKAYSMGSLARQWISDYLGLPGTQLVRFDPEQRRLSDRRWTGEIEAEAAFADGFALLVASTASLAELNRRLVERGEPPVTMQRFRPNIVLDGLGQANEEDFIDTLTLDTGGEPVVLKLVKPCTRCSMPDVNPETGQAGTAVGHALASYRSDARMGGAITFGMNAIVVSGFGATLRVGSSVAATLAI